MYFFPICLLLSPCSSPVRFSLASTMRRWILSGETRRSNTLTDARVSSHSSARLQPLCTPLSVSHRRLLFSSQSTRLLLHPQCPTPTTTSHRQHQYRYHQGLDGSSPSLIQIHSPRRHDLRSKSLPQQRQSNQRANGRNLRRSIGTRTFESHLSSVPIPKADHLPQIILCGALGGMSSSSSLIHFTFNSKIILYPNLPTDFDLNQSNNIKLKQSPLSSTSS